MALDEKYDVKTCKQSTDANPSLISQLLGVREKPSTNHLLQRDINPSLLSELLGAKQNPSTNHPLPSRLDHSLDSGAQLQYT